MGSLSLQFIREQHPDLTPEEFARKHVAENPPYRFAIIYTNHFIGGDAPTDIAFGFMEEERRQYMALANARVIYDKDDPVFDRNRSGQESDLLAVLSLNLAQGGPDRSYADHAVTRELVEAVHDADPTTALGLADKVIRDFPDWDLGYSWKGTLLLKAGKADEAVAAWAQGLEKCARTAGLCERLSDHHFEQGDLRAGAKWLLTCLNTQIRHSTFDTVRPFLTAAHWMRAWGEGAAAESLMGYSARGAHGVIAFDSRGSDKAFALADRLRTAGLHVAISEVVRRMLRPTTEADVAGKCTFCQAPAKVERIKYYYGYASKIGSLGPQIIPPENVAVGHGNIRLCRKCGRLRPLNKPLRPVRLWSIVGSLLALLLLSIYALIDTDHAWDVLKAILVVLTLLVGIGFTALTMLLLRPSNRDRRILEEFIAEMNNGEHVAEIQRAIAVEKGATVLYKEYAPMFWTQAEYRAAFNKTQR